MRLYDKALKKGLIPGLDFNIIGINSTEIENPGDPNVEIFISVTIRAKEEIAKIINKPKEEVPFDLGLEGRVG